MLDPVLICHKKDEKAVKLLCDTFLHLSPRSDTGLNFLGAGGGNSILNQTHNAFSCVILLFCVKHVEENIERSLILRKTNEITF